MKGHLLMSKKDLFAEAKLGRKTVFERVKEGEMTPRRAGRA